MSCWINPGVVIGSDFGRERNGKALVGSVILSNPAAGINEI